MLFARFLICRQKCLSKILIETRAGMNNIFNANYESLILNFSNFGDHD